MSRIGTQVALTVAGFDPTGGAGVTADLKVFAAHGIFGISCVSGLTVQSTVGVKRVEAVGAATLGEMLECVCGDIAPGGIKIGMLGTAENVKVVARFVSGWKGRVPVVLDPVLRSSSGRELLSGEGVEAMKGELLPVVDWVTPNVEELRVLTGLGCEGRAGVEGAAVALQRMGVGNVVVTGGDSATPDDFVLLEAGGRLWVTGTRVETTSTHGTGCAFSSALLCEVMLGSSAMDAVGGAKRYVVGGLRNAPGLGSGRGPLDLFWGFRR